jgi:hypothetical protein
MNMSVSGSSSFVLDEPVAVPRPKETNERSRFMKSLAESCVAFSSPPSSRTRFVTGWAELASPANKSAALFAGGSSSG